MNSQICWCFSGVHCSALNCHSWSSWHREADQCIRSYCAVPGSRGTRRFTHFRQVYISSLWHLPVTVTV